ncbi:MAG: FGGY-family carbohydrate kinase [Rhizobiales bacterium]|nr:FGGY-family carbohydrate kinase [Hyphomicrobiales bacterium]MBO6697549.1 FGGY-family carbohydrate kinase [Hyphomicrobiales bacterium]MBO6736196.1 FGGY-family carbohydrate kinase [Hyphomicrobiales bacterium]MBO6912666.1 FGGY-family carbohydrate kinase [Hyphomicrobiales bacterium]MBO6956399.1 FGGY-family carbohydrate kinase [Hyphomicrobiales bacterium]
MTNGASDFALGIDIGTSGVRTAVVNGNGSVIGTAKASHASTSNEDALAWWDAVSRALDTQIQQLQTLGIDPQHISRAAVDGTSGSIVLVDDQLTPVTPALLYNSSGFTPEAERINHFAEPTSITRGSSSALARMLHLQAHDKAGKAKHLMHQADFITAKLAGTSLGSDDNNALKLGWDPETCRWPSWFEALGVRTEILPDVHRTGTPIATLGGDIAKRFALSPTLQLHAGTTDSIAAFLASGGRHVGDAVTSLGTTLAIKLLSDKRIDDPVSGVYSHKVGNSWLAGGASNTGGGVLAAFFTSDELTALSAQIDPKTPSDLDYYPLLKPGERFPINDPDLAPRLAPRPQSDADFLKGMLESIARIEAQGYARLTELGAPAPKRVLTAGGGAKNPVWTAIRERHLGVPIVQADESEASVGVARLCWRAT